MILNQDFYFKKTDVVAKSLLGKILNLRLGSVIQKARIVEVEAYLGIQDPACHTYKNKRTNRTQSMYLAGGHSYVYLIYGMYHCLNVVTRDSSHPEAVLIRAVQPLSAALEFNKKKISTNGPGKLCKHFGINKSHDQMQLWKRTSPLFISQDDFQITKAEIVSCSRVGVDYAGEAAQWPLRFYISGNPYVSKIKK